MASVPLCVRICLAVVWRRGHDQESQTRILVASGLSWPPRGSAPLNVKSMRAARLSSSGLSVAVPPRQRSMTACKTEASREGAMENDS